uniref:polypeptide N-acetylgalactosaminyltransferase n=1 Tax=Chelonoidis abingdonii TaxID=106734 RepID=A0A8C0G600_CHEAB
MPAAAGHSSFWERRGASAAGSLLHCRTFSSPDLEIVRGQRRPDRNVSDDRLDRNVKWAGFGPRAIFFPPPGLWRTQVQACLVGTNELPGRNGCWSPVMAGGLFAVDREWFWELGGYDPGLEIWGGEQYEISFKVWMCGGGMFDVPCSRVGHIYRKYVPYKVPSGTSLARNLKRVAETWMDEFAEYVYQRRPEYRHLSTGDISAQKELRKHLKCKDFKWFMAAVAWDVPKYYPPVEPPPAAWGEIRNVAANLCVDSKHGATGTELRLDVCVKDGSERTWSHEQLFTFGWREDIRPGEPLHTRKFCFDAISHSSPVTLYDCHGMKGNQHWSYRKDKTMFHPVSNSCIDCNPAEKKIFMNRCDPLSETQQWIFEHINMTVLEKFNGKASS